MKKRTTLPDALSTASCYSGKISELAKDLSDEIVLDSDNKVEIDFEGGVKFAQLVWDKVKESTKECSGKDIVVNLPDTLAGKIVAFAMQFLGFKL